jgi:putative FmdB family regulatory protein
MPTYQYRCAKCGEQFEIWQSIHDDALTRHPGCGGKVTRVLAPAGIVLKGSGFYRTDSRAAARKSGSKDKEHATDGAGSGGNGASGDSKGSADAKESTGSAESKGSKEPKDSKDSKGSKDSKPSKTGRSST